MPERYRFDQRFGRRMPVRADHWRFKDGYPAHDHDFHELALITSGNGIHRCAAGTTPLSRGDLVLVRPGAWHAYERCRDLHLWDCCFDSGLLARELAWLMDAPAIHRLLWSVPLAAPGPGLLLLPLDSPRTKAAEDLLARINAQPADRLPTARVTQVALLAQLFALVAESRPSTPDGDSPAIHPAVPLVLRLLEDHPEASWTLTGLGLRAGLEPTYLVRVFRSVTGVPPLTYLHRRRCERAAHLLTTTRAPVAEIAALVGWNDPNLFARRFRAHHGLTATQWRKRHQSV